MIEFENKGTYSGNPFSVAENVRFNG